MKKTKILISSLFIVSLLSLSACALFNDDDLAVKNSFNPISSSSEEDPNTVRAGGVVAKEVEEVPNAYCFKSIAYGKAEKIINTYKTGGENFNGYNINSGNDYYSNKSGNNYDLYVPHSTPRNDKHVVVLFIHGGAWVSGFKTEVNPYVHEFANRGYVTATLKYTLLKRTMDDTSLSIFRNLDEIDACIASIKSVLEELEFDTSKTNLVIGGASSGAHLAMLYSYSRGSKSQLPIRFIVDAVGPVEIKPETWKCFGNASEAVLNAGITYDAIQAQEADSNLKKLKVAGESYYWNEYQTMRIANGMCGLPYTLDEVKASTDESEESITNPNDASNSMTTPGGGEDLLSVTYYMNATNKFPMICAYAGKDSIVGIAQYAKLEKAMDDYGIEHEFFYFKDSDHAEITKKKNPTVYDAFLNKVDDWCKAI